MINLLLAAFCVLALALPSHARSSFTARFLEPIAGPDVEQTARLAVDFFPGDGEAIVGLSATMAGAPLSVSTTRGVATVLSDGFQLDLQAAPVGSQRTDTVTVALISQTSSVWSLSLATNVDTESQPSHRLQVPVPEQTPVAATAQVTPGRLYPGETVELTVTAEVAQGDGRPLRSLELDLPEQLTGIGEVVHQAGLARQAVRVSGMASGNVRIGVAVATDQLRRSPLAAITIPIVSLPTFDLDVPKGTARVGEPVTVRLTWTNQSSQDQTPGALSATLSTAFASARLQAPTGGVRLSADEEKGALNVSVQRARLEAGASEMVDVLLTPLAAGPFSCSAFAHPEDRADPVPLGKRVVPVVDEGGGDGPGPLSLTDLELARQGLRPALQEAIQSLPLVQGTSVRLESGRTDDGNWIVAGLLTDLLVASGLRVRTDSTAAHVLLYRLADARVVYSGAGSAWNLFDDSQRRDTRTEVFLSLEDSSGQVRWVRRVTAESSEKEAPAPAEWLGGAKGVDQVTVEEDRRALEIGLSGLIAGGLFFVFFAP